MEQSSKKKRGISLGVIVSWWILHDTLKLLFLNSATCFFFHTNVSQSSFSQLIIYFPCAFWRALGGWYVSIAQKCHHDVVVCLLFWNNSLYEFLMCPPHPYPLLRLKIPTLNLYYSSTVYWPIFPLYFSFSVVHSSGKAFAQRNTSRAKWPLKLSSSSGKISQLLLTEFEEALRTLIND